LTSAYFAGMCLWRTAQEWFGGQMVR